MDYRESTSNALRYVVAGMFLAIFLIGFSSNAKAQQETITITATVPSQDAPPSGGSTGGGGGTQAVPEGLATAVFSGYASPGSVVTIVLDSRKRATTIAGSDSMFVFTAERLTAGTRGFSIYSEDGRGGRSATQTFSIRVASDLITTVSGIFISPTIAVNRTTVIQGESITIQGRTAPESAVSITVNSIAKLNFETTADTAGFYSHTFETDPLEEGLHTAQSRSSLRGALSYLSPVAEFRVGDGEDVTPNSSRGDLNADKRVNLVDFSILAFWFKKPSPPVSVDLNSDGVVNLVDFSIMAYAWTG